MPAARLSTIETAPVDAKAGCLYPNNARALLEAKSRGFDNAIVCDMVGLRTLASCSLATFKSCRRS